MGTLKQLLPFHGKPLIEHGIAALLEAGLEDAVVVLSPAQADVMRIVAGHPVRQVFNETPGSDMAASVRAGLAKVDPASTAVIVPSRRAPVLIRIKVACRLGWKRKLSSRV